MRNFAGSLSCSRPVLLLELDLVDELDFILFELLDFAELDEDLPFWKLEELIESTLLEDFALMELLLDPIATLQDDEERSLQDDEEGLLQDDEEESAAEDDEDEFVADDDKTVLELEDVAFEELTYMFFVQKVSGSSMNAFANF